eukprot:TRINITY_DN17207_c0_g1_i1.p1 TRINITY_DN17207_c0_g1~~TRINITY_DN17207_c0_g1_i1.p1  ORF type:complete len:542 (+),score=83.67 TRINITY_DN17207_c0_g1_i1:149-1774(+)
MARPGTVDYSKWERMAAELSSSDDDRPQPRPPLRPPSPTRELQQRFGDFPRSALDQEEDDADDDYECTEDEDDEEVNSHHVRRVARRITGTCLHCGAADAIKRCSRCQSVWFCDIDCQAAAWKGHAVNCFAKSETEAWWGKLSSSSGEGTRDMAEILRQRLEFRRAVAATRERRKAAAEAAARAAEARAREGLAKGGKGGKDQDDKEETCAVCQCSECTGVYVQSIMNDLEASYPPKCSMCRAEIPSQTFERQLNDQQQQLLAEFVAHKSLSASETMLKCQCGYMEIRTDKPVLWWCPACSRGECQVCNQVLPDGVGDDLSAVTSTEKGAEIDLLLRPHVVGCANLREAKQKVDKALESGQKMPCPGCGLAGMKDESCTHMSCPRCQTSWCYLCGLSVEDCDKAPPRQPGHRSNDIFLHNVDWEVNPRRCPMYLTQILEVDPAWLGDNFEDGDDVADDECLAYFHRWRTIKLLQEVREEVGAETFEQVWLHFASVRRAGYELEDIVHTDTSVLIDRDAFVAEESDEGVSDGELERSDDDDL